VSSLEIATREMVAYLELSHASATEMSSGGTSLGLMARNGFACA
jgi:hypothetical protein